MKLIVVAALAFVAVAYAAPAGPTEEPAVILRSEYEQQPEGAYVFSYETSNGIQRQENGELKEALDEENKPHKVVVVRGSYTFIDEEGKPQTITYFADETGYHAEGDAIPKEPVARR